MSTSQPLQVILSPSQVVQAQIALNQLQTLLGLNPTSSASPEASPPQSTPSETAHLTPTPIKDGSVGTSANQVAWAGRIKKIHGDANGQVFLDRVKWICDTLHLDPSNLLSCMAFETGERFSANVKNPSSSATGLIQFMDATAKGLGTTTQRLAAMTAWDQLNFVYKYFADQIKYHGAITNLEDTYMAILLPSAIGKPVEHALFVEGNRSYTVNSGLDVDRNHVVTKLEAAGKVREKLAKGFLPENVGSL